MTLYTSWFGKYSVPQNGDTATFRNEANLSEIHCMQVELSKTDACQDEKLSKSLTKILKQNSSEHRFT